MYPSDDYIRRDLYFHNYSFSDLLMSGTLRIARIHDRYTAVSVTACIFSIDHFGVWHEIRD